MKTPNQAALAVLFAAITTVAGCASPGKPHDGNIGGAGHRAGAMATSHRLALDLQHAVEQFIEAADRSDSAVVASMYAPDFVNVRITDEGDVLRLERGQLLAIFGRAGGHHIPTKSTAIHHVEAVGDTGFVLLTRTKDLGNGWETMFYSLVWKREGEKWLLLREFVHQRSLPKNRQATKP